jgi:hypothetical protein
VSGAVGCVELGVVGVDGDAVIASNSASVIPSQALISSYSSHHVGL